MAVNRTPKRPFGKDRIQYQPRTSLGSLSDTDVDVLSNGDALLYNVSTQTWVAGSAGGHTQQHAMTSTADHSATAYRTFFSNSSGDVTELGHGASGEVLTSGGASADPAWGAVAGGHTQSHAMTSTSDHSASNWSLFHSNGAGQVVEIALGTSGDVLTAGGAAAVPTWETPSAGSALTNFRDNVLFGEGLYNSILTFSTDSDGIRVLPTSGENSVIRMYNAAGTQKGTFQADNSTYGMVVHNGVVSDVVTLLGTDSSSALHTLLVGDPNAGVNLYYDGTLTASSNAAGMAMRASSFPQVQFANASATTTYGFLFFAVSNNDFVMRSDTNSADIMLVGQTSAGADIDMAVFNPDGDITFVPGGTGNVLLGNMEFDADQTIGAGQDNYVLTYDNATGHISLEAAAGGGSALTNFVDDGLAGDMLYNSTVVAATHGSGLRIDAANPFFAWHNVAGTRLSYFQNNVTNNHLIIQNEVTSDTVLIRGTNNSPAVSTMLEMDPNGPVDIYHDGVQVLETNVAGLVAVGPTSTNAQFVLQELGVNKVQLFWSRTANIATLRANEASAHMQLQGTNASSANNVMVDLDPDTGVDLYYAGEKMMWTNGSGIAVKDATAGTDQPGLIFADDSDANLVVMRSFPAEFLIANQINSAHITLDGKNSVGTTVEMASFDPDVGVGFNGSAAAVPQTYTLNATSVVDRTLLASASATTTNNNNVLAALITDLRSLGLAV